MSSKMDSLLGLLCWWKRIEMDSSQMYRCLTEGYGAKEIAAARTRWMQVVGGKVDDGGEETDAECAKDLLRLVLEVAAEDEEVDFSISCAELARMTGGPWAPIVAGALNRPHHVCPYCKKDFSRKFKLQCHVRKFHETQGGFVCTYCGKVFGERGNLAQHEETFHVGKKDDDEEEEEKKEEFTSNCATCKKSFCSGVEHKSKVKKKKRILCQFPGCNSQFTTTWQERQHLNAKHYKKRPFSCDQGRNSPIVA
jgi:hypothetical protein